MQPTKKAGRLTRFRSRIDFSLKASPIISSSVVVEKIHLGLAIGLWKALSSRWQIQVLEWQKPRLARKEESTIYVQNWYTTFRGFGSVSYGQSTIQYTLLHASQQSIPPLSLTVTVLQHDRQVLLVVINGKFNQNATVWHVLKLEIWKKIY